MSTLVGRSTRLYRASPDPKLRLAEEEIYATYGDRVSVEEKKKTLNKFGTTTNADSGVLTTVMELQDNERNETYVTTNAIDSIVSDDASNAQEITLEGHTIDGNGLLTFVTQDVTLNGTTPATLGTAMARATRGYIKEQTFASPATALAASSRVYVYDSSSTSVSGGSPNTASATKLIIADPDDQSLKCSTAISNSDYLIVTSLYCGALRNNAAKVDVRFQVRKIGGVFRTIAPVVSLNTAGTGSFLKLFDPHLIVPKNSDVRVVATSDTDNTQVSAEFSGRLAKVVG